MDPVNKPSHYNSHPSGVEAIQLTRHMSFGIGNAFKYVFRWRHKGGIEDLHKALTYVVRELDDRFRSQHYRDIGEVIKAMHDDNSDEEEIQALHEIYKAALGTRHLMWAAKHIRNLIRQEEEKENVSE